METVGARIDVAMDAQLPWISSDGRAMRWRPGRLAHLLGVHPKTVDRWLDDESVPDAVTLDAIGDLFQVRTEWLLWGGSEPRVRSTVGVDDVIAVRPLYLVTGPIGIGVLHQTLRGEFVMKREFWSGFGERTGPPSKPKNAVWWWRAISPTVRVMFGNEFARILKDHPPIASHEQRGRIAADRLLYFIENAYEWDRKSGRRRLTKSHVRSAAWTDHLLRVIGQAMKDDREIAS